MMDSGVGLPRIDDLDGAEFWQACNEHRLLFQQCATCGNRQFYPRLFCTKCHLDTLRWEVSSNRGTIHSFTVVRRAATAALQSRTPYTIALVDLDDGVRMMTNLIGLSPDLVEIGSRVLVCFTQVAPNITLPLFTVEE